MENRPQINFEINVPTRVKLLYDSPKVGTSNYGEYYLYAISNGSDKQYSMFAEKSVHEVLKEHGKGTEAIITKLVTQGKGKKTLNTVWDVQIINSKGSDEHPNEQPKQNPYLENMLQSFADAIKVQEKFNGMANVNQLAVTMFIQRTKANGL